LREVDEMLSTQTHRFHAGDKVYEQHRDGTRSYGRVIGFTPSGRPKIVTRGVTERGVDNARLHRVG
jgi:hypothetical protein